MSGNTKPDSMFSTVYRAITVALLAQVVVYFFYPTAFWITGDRFRLQFEPLTHNPWTQEITESPQTRHRILGPVIGYVLGLHGHAALLITVLGGTVMLMVTYLVMRKETNAPWATWSTFLVATSQTLITSQTWIGYQDAIGGAAVASCLLVKKPWLGTIILFLGMLADERCAVAFPFVVLWHFQDGQPNHWQRAISWTLCLLAALGLWIGYFYFSLHHFLSPEQLVGYDVGGASHRLLRKNIAILPLGFLESIRGGWMIIGYGFLILVRQRHWLIVVAALAGTMACLIQAGMVTDISRSASVVWPLMLLSLRIVYQAETQHGLFLLKAVVFFNFLTPCYQVIGSLLGDTPSPYYLDLFYPLPIAIFRWWSLGA